MIENLLQLGGGRLLIPIIVVVAGVAPVMADPQAAGNRSTAASSRGRTARRIETSGDGVGRCTIRRDPVTVHASASI